MNWSTKTLCFSSHGAHSVFCVCERAPHARLYRMSSSACAFCADTYLHHVPVRAWVLFI